MQPVYSNAGFVQPLSIRQNARFAVHLTVTNPDGTAYDLTGAEVRARVTNRASTPVFYDFVFDAPDGNEIYGYLEEVVTATMVPSPVGRLVDPDHSWQCDIKTVAGEIIPYCYGPVTVVAGLIEWP